MKAVDQSHSSNSICPYCLHGYQVECEDYNEDPHEVECDSCGMKYWLSQSFDVTHNTTGDCKLNGLEHEYKERTSARTGEKYWCCTQCDKVTIKPTKREE